MTQGASNKPRCDVCENKLVKNGKTTAGRTRWRCKHCGASTTQQRTDITRKAEFTAFINWLGSKQSRGDFDTSARSFTRHTTWCWNVTPVVTPTGEIHDQIMLDGTYFNGWCVLIAHTGRHVIDWQWTDREKTASWTALIERIPAPAYAIVDGNGPLHTVIKKHWPDTKIQRCYFHIRQAADRHLTGRPNLEANKELKALFTALPRVRNPEEAAGWVTMFAEWESTWRAFLKHRTYAKNATQRPAHVAAHRNWWYTHYGTRRAWKFLSNLIKTGELFTYLEPEARTMGIKRSTSPLEGGPNASIKRLLRDHRGLTPDHARRAVDWQLYAQTHNPKDPWEFVTEAHWNPPKPQSRAEDRDRIGPAGYDAGFTYEDGIGLRQGWGGRST